MGLHKNVTAFKFAIWPKVLIIPPKLQNCHKGSTVSEHTFVSLYYSSETCFICCKVCSPRLVTPLQNATFATFMPFYKNPYNLKKSNTLYSLSLETYHSSIKTKPKITNKRGSISC